MVADEVKVNIEIGKVLEVCRDIELVNAELYRYFAEIFSSHPAMAALWHKTAQEEENHAQQFVLVLKMRKETIADSLFIDGSKAENTLNIVKSYYNTVKNTPPSMLEALSAAIKIEKGLVSFHLASAVHFVQDSHKKLFSAMMAADQEHIEALQKFHKRLTGDAGSTVAPL